MLANRMLRYALTGHFIEKKILTKNIVIQSITFINGRVGYECQKKPQRFLKLRNHAFILGFQNKHRTQSNILRRRWPKEEKRWHQVNFTCGIAEGQNEVRPNVPVFK